MSNTLFTNSANNLNALHGATALGTNFMRFVAIILAVLATAKVLTVQWLYRAASDDVIVNAYRPRALDACSRDARKAFGLETAVWSLHVPIRLEIGMAGIAVNIWQIDDPAWAQRYRNPFLHITAGIAGLQVKCTYDVINGTTTAAKV